MERVATPEATVRSWLQTLSNWGRWGRDDELGTLNHLGAAERAAALRLATGAATVSCSLPVLFGRPPHGASGRSESGPHPSWSVPQRFVVQDGDAAKDPTIRHSAYDAFLIAPHGPVVTHLDAPDHTVLDGRVYNGLPASSAPQPGKKGTIEAVRDGVLGRGVLLDVAAHLGRDWLDDGEAVYPEDLEACERDVGVTVGKGDILFVRTGYRSRVFGPPTKRFAPRPGLQAACLPWLAQREVAVLGADVSIDVVPHGYEAIGLPIHTVGMWAMGLWLIDNCGLEELAQHCARLGRWAFTSVLAPLVLPSGTGSPMNPIAIF